jgi:SSS family solute:Na+ symporter
VPIYGSLQLFFGEIAFLNRMAITFVLVLLVMSVITWLKPLPKPVELPRRSDFDMSPTPRAVWFAAAVVVVTLALYVIFW